MAGTCNPILAFGVALLVLDSSSVVGAELSTCAQMLRSLSETSATASRRADEAAQNERALSDCKQFPNVYDFGRDGCKLQMTQLKNSAEDMAQQFGFLKQRLEFVLQACGG